MEEEFTLTDEQVASWRSILVTMPLPPFGLALRGYALIMPREQVVNVVKKLNEILQEERVLMPDEAIKDVEADNITRTRPRKPGPVRR